MSIHSFLSPRVTRPRVGTSCAKLSLLGALLLAACIETSTPEQSLTLLPPATLSNQAVFVDTTGSQAFLLNVEGELVPEAKRVSLPERPITVVRRSEHDELLVLTTGDPDKSDSPPTLTILDAEGVKTKYPLSAAFSSMVQSDDGRYVILQFGTSTVATQLLYNRNEIAIIDLDQEPSQSNPKVRTLRGFGDAPSKIMFSPLMDLAGQKRRLGVVLFDQVVDIFDLSHWDRPEFTIELVPPSSSRGPIKLTDMVADTDANKLYLRGVLSADIYVIQLSPRDTQGDASKNDFVPSLNQLAIGSTVQDMALYGPPEARRLLALAGGVAYVVDADSSRVIPVELPASASSLSLFQGRAPEVDTVATRAFLSAPQSSSLVFLDLGQIDERRSRNAELLVVERYEEVIALSQAEGGNNLVMLRHPGSLGASVVNLDSRTVQRLSSRADLARGIIDRNLNRVWLAPPGQRQVAYVDLSDPNRIQPSEVTLDYPIDDVLLFTGGPSKRVVVTHPAAMGRATVLSAESIRDTTQGLTLEGFLLRK